MSYIGKSLISIPENVQVVYNKDENYLNIFSNNLFYKLNLPKELKSNIDKASLQLTVTENSKQSNMLSGTYNKLIRNIITGISSLFRKELHLIGLGSRASVIDTTLELKIGHNKLIKYPIPSDISIKSVRNVVIYVEGHDLKRVSDVAAQIRSLRLPDVYSGKGIRYRDEIIYFKEGKKKKK
jgi:large subunit ribosomal protein L6